MLRNINSPGYALRKPIIVGAFFYKYPKAQIGDCCAWITGESTQNLDVAFCYQLITDQFAKPVSSGNCKQMLLSINCYTVSKSVIVQHIGLGQNRLCYFNRLVKRECSDCLGRCSVNRSKSLGKFRASAYFDGINEHLQDAIV